MNPAGDIDVCLSVTFEYCVLSGRAGHSSRGVLTNVVCLSEIVQPQ